MLFEAEPLDLGPDVRAVGVELVEDAQDREPVRGADATRVWSRVLPAIAKEEPWALDFFSHLDRVREYCRNHAMEVREAADRCLVVPSPPPEKLESLFDRFESETFGARAGSRVVAGDPDLENDLACRGPDAYQPAFPNYYFCAICDFENGSLVVLSHRLWASEIIRLARGVLAGLDVQVRLPAN
jgi:hypothetical protein